MPCRGTRAEERAVQSQAPAQPRSLPPEELTAHLEGVDAKLVDFGNACWVHKQFTPDIQTRQYRCPEVGQLTVLHCQACHLQNLHLLSSAMSLHCLQTHNIQLHAQRLTSLLRHLKLHPAPGC